MLGLYYVIRWRLLAGSRIKVRLINKVKSFIDALKANFHLAYRAFFSIVLILSAIHLYLSCAVELD